MTTETKLARKNQQVGKLLQLAAKNYSEPKFDAVVAGWPNVDAVAKIYVGSNSLTTAQIGWTSVSDAT